ncbi:MAG: hypothetical protein PHV24_02265 [Candidatus Kapabacteria bacterium]|nr:hypothetical protein [Candidatus Kapabacteria bacterium]
MKKLSIIFCAIALVFCCTMSDANAAPKAKKYTGTVVALTDYIKGTETLTKAEAVEKAEKGIPVVLKVGTTKAGKLYFVINEDGSFGGKNLAKYAANKKVIVEGIKKIKNGVNYIIATKISSGD